MWYSLTMKMRRILLTFTIIITLLFTGQAQVFGAGDEPDVHGDSVILMNLENGDVLYEKNAHEVRDPASVTKILTLMIVLDTLEMDQEVTVPDNVDGSGTTIHLVPGEKMTVRNLIYGMMLKSGNDAAQVLALEAGGSIEHFAEMMNARAEECGAHDTKYKNPSGLNPDAVNNVTTAYDQALIMGAAMKDERFREIVSTARYTIPATNKSDERVLRNSNFCLWVTSRKRTINGQKMTIKYDGCTGGKTGHSSTAGYCFVGTAKRDNMELVAVTLGAPNFYDRFTDPMKLWEYGFNHYKTYTAAAVGEVLTSQKVSRGSLAEVDIGVNEDVDITVSKDYDAKHNISTSINLNEKTLTAPIQKGEVLGTLEVYDENGEQIEESELVALEEVKEGGILSHIGIADEDARVFMLMVFSLAIILGLIILIIVRLRKGKTEQGLN